MSVFKINLKPVVKERDYEVKIVGSGRKEHKCCVCGEVIKVGLSSVSFTKRVTIGLQTKYTTYRTCMGRRGHSTCTKTKAKELNIDLDDDKI